MQEINISKLKEYELAIEAILFAMGKSVNIKEICKYLDISEEVAKQSLDYLSKRYEKHSALKLIKLENSYQICTKDEYFDILVKIVKNPKKPVLSDSILESLAIIAYKQPITKLEVEKIRGVSSDYAINKLLEYNLIYEVSRLEAPGRPILFATTEEFLKHFSMDSKNSLPDIDIEV